MIREYALNDAIRVIFHWAEFSAQKDNFYCILTPTLG